MALSVRLESFSIRRGSGGPGRHRGGDGVERRVCFLEPMTAVILANHRRVAPFGVAGGSPGAVGRNWVERVDGTREEFGATCKVEMRAGDVFVIQTPAAADTARPSEDARCLKLHRFADRRVAKSATALRDARKIRSPVCAENRSGPSAGSGDRRVRRFPA
jgi:N-methylhydantoinase B/oxoprolinase/acetone carboxylase alpha subunit